MDGNVSNNTFSHKFFKLRFSNENTFISVQKFLNQRLCLILDLYLQSLTLTIDPRFLATALKPKIVVLEPSIEQISSDTKVENVLLTSQSARIIYKCSIALALANYLKIAPQTIAVNLINLLDFERENNSHKSAGNLNIEITKSGWINFYLDSKSLASWLKRLFLLVQTTNTLDRDLRFICQLADTPANLFPVQYIHARCCSWLNLAAREGLIGFADNERENSPWQLSQPITISWLDAESNLFRTCLPKNQLTGLNWQSNIARQLLFCLLKAVFWEK